MGACKITALCCHKALYAGLKPEETTRAWVDGVQIVETPCSGKVDAIYLLKAFEKGADAVVVLACDQRVCATLEGAKRAARRVERTKALLAEAGVDPARLVFQVVRRPALAALPAIFSRVRETVNAMGER